MQINKLQKNKLTEKKKGFIGSIGDDLPSLIPLFFALMIFFSALAFAFTTINERNATINTYIDSLTVSRSALSDGSFASLDEFAESKKSLVTLSNYIYGLIYLPSSGEYNFESMFEYNLNDAFVKECGNDIKLADDLVITSKGVVPSCSSSDEKPFFLMSSGVAENIDDPTMILQDLKHKKYFYYLYPVTLLTPNGYKVLYLIVLVW